MKENNNDITHAFEQALNMQGYGFQHRVISEIKKFYDEGKCQWWPYVNEFPVDIQGASTRIDSILRYAHKDIYAIMETKRVNPTHSNWCFSYKPASNHHLSNKFYVEGLTLFSNCLTSIIKDIWGSDNIYTIAVEAKSKGNGDSCGKGRGVIEESVTQLCRGLNGIIEYFKKTPGSISTYPMFVLPILCTTANLWVTDVKMDDANLNDGMIKLSNQQVKKVNWLHYHYPQSPGLKHSVRPRCIQQDMRNKIYDEYIRDIIIMNPEGLQDFFCDRNWQDIF
ncbi:hypothetical protein E0765_12385 [Sulfuricurvum sp. IAE1]|uniref:hypothetical protein n=1 Tax=Sulfuricurvum sp. IAE1 TaxID=2546102 RepID=UPI00105357BA|nr:hypothetical protein [Sulfuricurvum sp. IAE1]TDA62368.1 hypothetical protein E0765_12385 [Sulfuricurvum sp. IAE1]